MTDGNLLQVAAGELPTAQKHLRGVNAMVNSGGGAGELGLTGLLERMYWKFMGTLDLQATEIELVCTKRLAQD